MTSTIPHLNPLLTYTCAIQQCESKRQAIEESIRAMEDRISFFRGFIEKYDAGVISSDEKNNAVGDSEVEEVDRNRIDLEIVPGSRPTLSSEVHIPSPSQHTERDLESFPVTNVTSNPNQTSYHTVEDLESIPVTNATSNPNQHHLEQTSLPHPQDTKISNPEFDRDWEWIDSSPSTGDGEAETEGMEGVEYSYVEERAWIGDEWLGVKRKVGWGGGGGNGRGKRGKLCVVG